jgi:glycerol transport system ATP-binding protein
VKGGKALFAGQVIEAANAKLAKDGKLEIGVRPEFVSVAKTGLDAEVTKVSDAGRFRIVETHAAGSTIKLLVPEDETVPTGRVKLAFDKAHTQIYANDWLVGQAR